MKKVFFLGLAVTLSLSSLFAKVKTLPEIKEVVDLVALDATFINEFILGLHPSTAVACKEGTSLPLSFLHKCNLYSLKYVPNLTVTVEQPCYFRVTGKKVYMSQDLVTWEKGDKIFDGTPSFNVKIDAQSGISIESSTEWSKEES